MSVRAWRSPLILFSLCMATAVASPAQTFRVLLAFNGTNGSQPSGPLVQGFDGNLYGTTLGGGSQNAGTFFKVTTTGALTTIYSFCAHSNCADGGYPETGLALGKDGNFYGITTSGGSIGDGTIFKITPQGHLTVLHDFCSLTNCADGVGPRFIPLMQARDGNFYGASPNGGISGPLGSCGPCGIVFKITPAGSFNIVYNFCSQTNCADGYSPNQVIQAADGYLYGTTGNSLNSYGNGGTVFRLTATGALTTLYSFCSQANCTDGQSPKAGLTQGSDGYLYGTTAFGSANISGTVFKVAPSGALTTFYAFCSQTSCADGGRPESQLVRATDGNFYATTTYYGTQNGGTIFQLTPGGNLTGLYDFPSWRVDVPGVMQATDGNFYGTTDDVGTGYYGIIFKESTGLGPFIETLPTSGFVGAKVAILGTNLTGATAVSFNGKAATFTVVSGSEITTTVPTGATTGTVKVSTPTTTLLSNRVFQVR